MQTEFILIIVIILIYFLRREFHRNLTEKSFISIVNHTFRTPLTRIKWMSESLTQDISRKEQLDIANNLSNSTNRLLEIVDILAGIKDVYSSATYELKAVSLREMLEEAVKKYSSTLNERKLTLLMPTMHDMPLLSVDTKKISLVINAVIENAIWYSKDGGIIKIAAELKKGELILSIEDDGIGLSWKDRMNLFKRFYRGESAKKMNTDGMGLGLYISKEIIRRHHGRIYAKSKGKNKGTIFYISLPIHS